MKLNLRPVPLLIVMAWSQTAGVYAANVPAGVSSLSDAIDADAVSALDSDDNSDLAENQEQIELDYNNYVIRPEGESFDLKEEIRNQTDEIPIREFGLKQVILKIRSKTGKGVATLEIAGDIAEQKSVPNSVSEPDKFFRITLRNDNDSLNVNDKWNLFLKGDEMVLSRVILLLERRDGGANPQPQPTYTPIPSPVPTYIPVPEPTYIPVPQPTYIPVPVPTYYPDPYPTYYPDPYPTYYPPRPAPIIIIPRPRPYPRPYPTYYPPRPRPTYIPAPRPTYYPPRPQPTYIPGPRPIPAPRPTYVPGPRPTYHPGPRPTYVPGPRPTYNPGPRPTYNPGPRPAPVPRPTFNPGPRPGNPAPGPRPGNGGGGRPGGGGGRPGPGPRR